MPDDEFRAKQNDIAKKLATCINAMGLDRRTDGPILHAAIAAVMTHFIVGLVDHPDKWEQILEVWVRFMRRELSAQKANIGEIKGHA